MAGTKGNTVCIAGMGSYLPERVMTNADLEKIVDTSDEWIRTRTGISERRIARDDEATSSMAAEAAKCAIEDAGMIPEDVEAIIVATVTPDMVFPSTACLVQNLIGAGTAFCVDVEAVCSGFIYALEVANGLIASGMYANALVIGADKMSSIIDWEDRGTCILFGDAAGAVVLRAEDAESDKKGTMSSVTGADGAFADLLMIPAGGSRQPATSETVDKRLHYLRMDGNTVFKHAVRRMCRAARDAIEKAGLTIDDISCIIPHQANMRIVNAIAKRLGVTDPSKVFVNLDKLGNTTAASIPVALDEAFRTEHVKRGDKVLMVSFGGGFTWGATVIEL